VGILGLFNCQSAGSYRNNSRERLRKSEKKLKKDWKNETFCVIIHIGYIQFPLYETFHFLPGSGARDFVENLEEKTVNNKRKAAYRIWIVVMILLLLALPQTVSAASISARSASLRPGGKITLSIKGLAKGKTVKWKTASSKVASVSSKGVVTAMGAGKTKITGTVGKTVYTCTVTVASVKMSSASLTMEKGTTYKLSLKGAASSDKITWKTSASSVARVSSSGIVTAVGNGSAVITAVLNGKSYASRITVNETCTMSVNSLMLSPGSTYRLSVTGASSAVWRSSKTGVARVTSSGLVTAVGAGTAVITASAGGKTLTCTVTVKAAATTAKTITVIKPAASTSGTAGVVVNNKATSTTTEGSSADYKDTLSGEEKTVYGIIQNHKKTYPEGTTFTNADFRQWTGGIYIGGYGCAGFCFELSDLCFPGTFASMDPDMSTVNLRRTLKVGDIIRLSYNTHSVTVQEIYADKGYIVVGEANYNKKVHWGREITFSELAKSGTHVLSRYGNLRSKAAKAAFEASWSGLPVLKDIEQYGIGGEN